jgi:hypothetical protein
MRDFDEAAFDRAFGELVSANRWQEEPAYYPRYRTRYSGMLRRFAERAPERGCEVLDVGGGQLAYLAMALWDDHGCVADIDDTCFAGLRAHGIDAFEWNLALEDPPPARRFDAIFFSEVIEHLPVPGHIPPATPGASAPRWPAALLDPQPVPPAYSRLSGPRPAALRPLRPAGGAGLRPRPRVLGRASGVAVRASRLRRLRGRASGFYARAA